MVSGYRAGYVTGRWFTRIVKFYLAGKFINATSSKVVKLAKDHKIDSNNTKVVTENLFDCLEYLD